jgi:hypothetical protein
MKSFYILLLCVFTLVFTSCNFSENIFINEDGSGKMEFKFDGSGLMEMVGDEMTGNSEEVIDSTFSFKEIFDAKRDSISQLPQAEQDKLKMLENYKMHMVVDGEKKKLNFEMFTDFTSVNELQDMFKAMNSYSNMKGEGTEESKAKSNPFSSVGENENTELSYAFDGTVFTRTTKIIDKEIYKQMTDSLGEMSMMFGTSTYKLNYHFPKKIKSVSNENALFSDDRKSVTIEYGFMEYINNPEALNVEVVLED